MALVTIPYVCAGCGRWWSRDVSSRTFFIAPVRIEVPSGMKPCCAPDEDALDSDSEDK